MLTPAPSSDRKLKPAAANELMNCPDSVTELKQWQRDVMTARLAVLGAVESVAKAEGLTTNRAIERFLELLNNGMIDAAISDMAETANHRKGNDRSLTKGTIYRWIRDRKERGDIALAPLDTEELAVPNWARPFLAIWRQPQKRSIPDVLEEMTRLGMRTPSYGQAVRFMRKFSRLDAQRGRMTGSELRSIRGYVRRDKSRLLPNDLCVADGHSFKARIAHPVHGRPFHPEMEAIIDVGTRVCTGWSVGLAESSIVVADALRHAVTVNEQKPMGGAMAIFYTDRGGGNTAGTMSDEEIGILARIGATPETGRAGNPQGRGVIEELQGSLWVRAAKKLPTYTGKDMDKSAERKIYLLVQKDIKEQGRSDLLMPWGRFLQFAQDEVDAYNNRPHSGLPKITDPNTGLRRHMTPTEMWRAFVVHGWQPTLLSTDEIKDLFRPQIKVRTRRAQVNVFGNIYYHKLLEHYHGAELIVSYDIHDAKTVQVRDQQQRLICEAVWDANKRDFFPMPVVEQARQKRMERRLKLVEDKAWEIRQERKGVIGAPLPQEDPLVAATMPGEPAPERDIDMTEYEEVV